MNPFEKMALKNFDTTIMKVVQATHHQGDIWKNYHRSFLLKIC